MIIKFFLRKYLFISSKRITLSPKREHYARSTNIIELINKDNP